MIKIVSGGQTGVDRAALDAALELGIPCGGWCPEGRLAEDGRIPERYPLKELAGGGYAERTLQNVIDSDGTVIINFGELQGGTEQTLLFCVERAKPHELINAEKVSASKAARLIRAFVTKHRVKTLNIAGPRHSKEARAYGYAYSALQLFLRDGVAGVTRTD
ncbi:MAG TPA: putative molybdenum carrier protein [Burkholderiales bacterium]|nr:putative molybdenum carrier protein [Burkholderiales bacterium]